MSKDNVADSFRGQPQLMPEGRSATTPPIPGGHGSALASARAQGSSDQRDPANLTPQSAGHPGDSGRDITAPAGKGR
jgi:hypothetical protein